ASPVAPTSRSSTASTTASRWWKDRTAPSPASCRTPIPSRCSSRRPDPEAPRALRAAVAKRRAHGRPQGDSMALIELSHIEKTYDLGLSKVLALRDVDVSVDKGEFLAIVGQSGSGKLTLMNIVGCVDVPTRGRYRPPRRHVGELP